MDFTYNSYRHSIARICKVSLYGWVLLFGNFVLAQSDTTEQWSDLKFSGYIDIFYAYDFGQPQTEYRQTFLYNHNRHNEFNLNLGVLKASIEQPKFRANLALQAGTYTEDNYKSEPLLLRNVFECNAGIALLKNDNLWLDVGVLSSHIGFESAITFDNWTLTRSLLAESSPYYLTGAKLTFIPNTKWEFAALVCNGWQRIKRLRGNSLPGFCTQLKYLQSEKVRFNWSTFIGTDDPDSTRRMRYFNNLYGHFQVAEKLGFIVGFDLGLQQRKKHSSDLDFWYSPVMIARLSLTNHWAIAMRAEYYHDISGVIVSTPDGSFTTSGLSLNIDYTPFNELLCRLEGRSLTRHDDIFGLGDNLSSDNIFVVTSLALKF